ncbi:MAG: TOBE domain-containing protein [Asticcacaulis sp.]|nr:TOBE domain-containing protein [Asticcacaulis sp.]
MSTGLKALLMLRKGTDIQVGASRMDLLRHIAELGSISAAAKAVGLSYKGAWDAVQALNNLSARPLVVAQAGGRSGGAAEVTPAGLALIDAYRRVATLLETFAGRIHEVLDDTGVTTDDLMRSLAMKTSARNAWSGTVTSLTDGAVNAEVALDIGEGLELIAIVTRDSVETLGLKPGQAAVALVKSSFVLLAAGHDALPVSARNRLKGTVSAVTEGAVNDEVVLQLPGGRTVTAVVTSGSRRDLGLKVGAPAQALIKASHIILATD